jgi:hypothetical protein
VTVALLFRVNIQKKLMSLVLECTLVKHLSVFSISFSYRYNGIRQNSLPVEYALIEHEIEEIDSLISEVLENLNWNSESESFHLLHLTIAFKCEVVRFLRFTALNMFSRLT